MNKYFQGYSTTPIKRSKLEENILVYGGGFAMLLAFISGFLMLFF